MRSIRTLLTIAAIAALITVSSGARQSDAAFQGTPFDPATFSLKTELLIDGLDQPLYMLDANDDSGRMFIVEKTGLILIFKDGTLNETPFLDISSQVSSSSEQGLLSMALHPNFKSNGEFFIDYTDVNGDSQIERWHVGADTPDIADPTSAEPILSVDQPYANHNGGLVLFGPDGNLYIGFGDGGSQGDPNGNGQNLGVLLGKILRIDVDRTEGDLPYGIPEDNPSRAGRMPGPKSGRMDCATPGASVSTARPRLDNRGRGRRPMGRGGRRSSGNGRAQLRLGTDGGP